MDGLKTDSVIGKHMLEDYNYYGLQHKYTKKVFQCRVWTYQEGDSQNAWPLQRVTHYTPQPQVTACSAILLHHIHHQECSKHSLTTLILWVRHKCLLHEFWCYHSVFFLDRSRRSSCDGCLCYHFKRLHYTDIAKLLGNWQCSLSLLQEY